MSAIETAQTLRGNLIVIDEIICLHALWSKPSSQLQDLFEFGDHHDLLVSAGFEGEEVDEHESSFDDEVVGMIIEEGELTGYFFKALTPSPDYFGSKIEDGKAVHGTYTWGSKNFEWFFAQSLEEALPAILAWKDKLCTNALSEDLTK